MKVISAAGAESHKDNVPDISTVAPMRMKTNSKIRILYFIDFIKTASAGTEGQLLKLIGGLDRKRFEVGLVILGRTEWIAENRFKLGCSVHEFEIREFSKIRTYCEICRLYRFLKSWSPRIVHTFFPVSNVVGIVLSRITGVKHCLSSRRDYGQWMGPVSLIFTRLANVFAEKIVANSGPVKEITLRREKVNEQKVGIIYNGIDLADFARRLHQVKIESVRKELDIPDDSRVVGCVANFRAMKHLHTFLEAAELILQERKNIQFVLLGDGILRHDLENLAGRLNIKGNVNFLGRKSDILPYLAAIDIGVNCSEAEGLSNAIIEYMVAGIPCVVTNAGGNPDLVKDGATGLLFELDDAEELARKICFLLDHPDLCRRLARGAYDFVSKEFDLGTMISSYDRYYTGLLTGEL